jgi:hypothetical protein
MKTLTKLKQNSEKYFNVPSHSRSCNTPHLRLDNLIILLCVPKTKILQAPSKNQNPPSQVQVLKGKGRVSRTETSFWNKKNTNRNKKNMKSPKYSKG